MILSMQVMYGRNKNFNKILVFRLKKESRLKDKASHLRLVHKHYNDTPLYTDYSYFAQTLIKKNGL